MNHLLFSVLIFWVYDAQAGVSHEDDRVLLRHWEASVFKSATSATAMQINSSLLKPQGLGKWSYPVGRQRGMCPGEKYADLPTLGECSGFLLGDNQTLITAAHCHPFDTKGCEGVAWLFNIKKIPNSRQISLSDHQIYRCAKVLETLHDGHQDFAVIRLSQPVLGAIPFQAAPPDQGRLEDPLLAVGYPLGMEQTMTFGGKIQSLSKTHLTTSMDLFSKNSGSAIINLRTGKLEGIATNTAESIKFNSLDGCRYIPHKKDDSLVIVNRISAINHVQSTLLGDTEVEKKLTILNTCKNNAAFVVMKNRSEGNEWTTTEVTLPPGNSQEFLNTSGDFYVFAKNTSTQKAIVNGKDFFGFSEKIGQQQELAFKKVPSGSLNLECQIQSDDGD